MSDLSSDKLEQPARLMVITAHPDDAEFSAGGLMLKWASAGHEIMILCLTDGSAGHHQLPKEELASIRQDEALNAAALLGAKVIIWDVADGELAATVEYRKLLISAIRNYKPDLVVTHRTADYHPDHRACAQLVMDACYLLQVPNIVPAAPALTTIPPVLLFADRFQYPRPFQPDWIFDVGDVLSGVVELLHCHASQVYEWLPFTRSTPVPEHNRRQWLKQWYSKRPQNIAKRFAKPPISFAEAFEISEYGGHFDAQDFAFITPADIIETQQQDKS